MTTADKLEQIESDARSLIDNIPSMARLAAPEMVSRAESLVQDICELREDLSDGKG